MGSTAAFTVAGTAKVVRFNWPKYVAAAAVLAAAGVATGVGIGDRARTLLWLVAGLGAGWALTSLVATWWVYDHRRVYDRVADDLGDVGEWASVHAGFDDATANLARSVGRPPSAVVELAMVASASLRRARGDAPPVPAAPGAPDSLPLAAASTDTIFVTFAAHEIRDLAEQRSFFGELGRALRPGGRLVVTEHLRDLANAAVYGPGALHFQPASVWTERAAAAGFTCELDTSITPFVHRLVWRR